jgi:hypothetical protein
MEKSTQILLFGFAAVASCGLFLLIRCEREDMTARHYEEGSVCAHQRYAKDEPWRAQLEALAKAKPVESTTPGYTDPETSAGGIAGGAWFPRRARSRPAKPWWR